MTTVSDKADDKGENAPTYESVKVEPGTVFTTTGPDGTQTEFTADDKGEVTPNSAAEAAVLAGFTPPPEDAAAADQGATDGDDSAGTSRTLKGGKG
jgi:hypothetical protein